MHFSRHYFLLLIGLVACCLLIGNVGTAAELSANAIPFKHDAVSADISLSKILSSVLVCLLALALVLFFLKKKIKKNPAIHSNDSQLEVIESKRLNARSSLYVVSFAGKQYLLAQSEQGLSCIASEPQNTITTGHEK